MVVVVVVVKNTFALYMHVYLRDYDTMSFKRNRKPGSSLNRSLSQSNTCEREAIITGTKNWNYIYLLSSYPTVPVTKGSAKTARDKNKQAGKRASEQQKPNKNQTTINMEAFAI